MAAPQPRPAPLDFRLADEAATAALAAALAALTRPGDAIGLSGDLGTGKTVFARAFINALPHPGGKREAEEVPSPTFTLVQVYERSPAPVWHFDLYRLDRPEESLELGLDEALAEGISLIEWPERLGARLPREALVVRLDFGAGDGERLAHLEGGGSWPQRLLGLTVP